MADETTWQAARAKLYHTRLQHPEYSRMQLAQACNQSLSWVKKWLARYKAAGSDSSLTSLFQPKTKGDYYRSPRLDPVVLERLLDLRDNPPAELGRIPGPKALAYYLAQDAT